MNFRCLAAGVTVALAIGTALAPAAVRAAPETTAPADTASVREIRITVVTDRAFRDQHGWRELTHEAIGRATGDLPGAAGLRFLPGEYREWEPPPDVASLEDLLDAVTRDVSIRDDLLAYFTGTRPGDADHRRELGYAYLGWPALVLSTPQPREIAFASYLEKDLGLYFRHELGHVFGIPHLPGPDVMAVKHEDRSEDFGDLGLDVLRANRDMVFGAKVPFTGCDLETLRDVYLFLDDNGGIEPSLLVNLGVAFHHAGRAEEARTLFEASVARRRGSVAGWMGVARTTLALGDTAYAERIAENVTSKPDLSPVEKGALGEMWIRLGQCGQGRALVTEALAADSTRFNLWFTRGLSYFQEGAFDPARADFERALEREERPEAWFNLGLCCDALEDRESAARAFRRYLDLDPDGPYRERALDFLERQN